MDKALTEAISALGQVTDIVAPNGLHHLFASAALDAFPDAHLWLSPALARKRPDLLQRGQLLITPPTEWATDMQLTLIEGMPSIDEWVAFHRPSATLVTTDLVFNMHHNDGWLMPLILTMGGAWKRLAQSRLLRTQIKDRSKTRASYAALLTLPFEQLIMAHGDIVSTNAREKLAQALSWMDPALKLPLLAASLDKPGA